MTVNVLSSVNGSQWADGAPLIWPVSDTQVTRIVIGQLSEAQIEAALQRHSHLRRDPIRSEDMTGLAEAITQQGDVRLLPFMGLSDDAGFSGVDGFFIARLRVKN